MMETIYSDRFIYNATVYLKRTYQIQDLKILQNKCKSIFNNDPQGIYLSFLILALISKNLSNIGNVRRIRNTITDLYSEYKGKHIEPTTHTKVIYFLHEVQFLSPDMDYMDFYNLFFSREIAKQNDRKFSAFVLVRNRWAFATGRYMNLNEIGL